MVGVCLDDNARPMLLRQVAASVLAGTELSDSAVLLEVLL